MKDLIKAISSAVIITLWLAGIAIAKGFWPGAIAVCVPPYSWYVVVEKVMLYYGMIE